eukprot:TRINITY_DN3221_c0_g1_i6.p1 TRINITY_DN3221_c0_g1~~TRINITY_DN3221_c0_g1_i6.p1  ORF type:complete len:247 (-),score=-18.81 TRINITY_DN3221_c0_g1_i6:76-816(-)
MIPNFIILERYQRILLKKVQISKLRLQKAKDPVRIFFFGMCFTYQKYTIKISDMQGLILIAFSMCIFDISFSFIHIFFKIQMDTQVILQKNVWKNYINLQNNYVECIIQVYILGFYINKFKVFIDFVQTIKLKQPQEDFYIICLYNFYLESFYFFTRKIQKQDRKFVLDRFDLVCIISYAYVIIFYSTVSTISFYFQVQIVKTQNFIPACVTPQMFFWLQIQTIKNQWGLDYQLFRFFRVSAKSNS